VACSTPTADHNWATRTVDGTTTRHEYPRYFFSNKSTDILALCAAALDRLGIAHRRPRADTISVARRAAVAALDEVVGPKA
jgi:metal-dependent HD superfamily phosphatase/phosphodiesterase